MFSENSIDKKTRVLLLGGGYMAREYCKALRNLRLSDVRVITRSQKTATMIKDDFGFESYPGGYKSAISICKEKADLVIIALPIEELKESLTYLLSLGQERILVEKPLALDSGSVRQLQASLESKCVFVRVAFNRMLYPSFLKLRSLLQNEAAITSCRYTFTEWPHTINFQKSSARVYERWGISNSLHVISMAHALIGMPADLQARQYGSLPWHPSGAVFIGCGVSESGIPFSYHADWLSSGRWSIEVMTNKNAYRLMPLEELFVCPVGEVSWRKIECPSLFPDVKQGVAEEVLCAASFQKDSDEFCLPDLESAANHIEIAEKIFNYRDNGSVA